MYLASDPITYTVVLKNTISDLSSFQVLIPMVLRRLTPYRYFDCLFMWTTTQCFVFTSIVHLVMTLHMCTSVYTLAFFEFHLYSHCSKSYYVCIHTYELSTYLTTSKFTHIHKHCRQVHSYQLRIIIIINIIIMGYIPHKGYCMNTLHKLHVHAYVYSTNTCIDRV